MKPELDLVPMATERTHTVKSIRNLRDGLDPLSQPNDAARAIYLTREGLTFEGNLTDDVRSAARTAVRLRPLRRLTGHQRLTPDRSPIGQGRKCCSESHTVRPCGLHWLMRGFTAGR